jgi:hypothetical protein
MGMMKKKLLSLITLFFLVYSDLLTTMETMDENYADDENNSLLGLDDFDLSFQIESYLGDAMLQQQQQQQQQQFKQEQ